MSKIIIGYFCMMAAFMLTLDFPVSLFHLTSILFLLTIYLCKHFDTSVDRFLSVLRSVIRIE